MEVGTKLTFQEWQQKQKLIKSMNEEDREKYYEAERLGAEERLKAKQKLYTQQYRERNKKEIYEKNHEVVTCECGMDIKRHNLSKHRKTGFHLLKTNKQK